MKKRRSLFSRIVFISLLLNIILPNHILIGAASSDQINNFCCKIDSAFRSLRATIKCAFTKEKCTDEQRARIQNIIGAMLLALIVGAEIGFMVYFIKRGQRQEELMSQLKQIAKQVQQKEHLKEFKEWDNATTIREAMDIALTAIGKGLVVTPEIIDELDQIDNEAMSRKLWGWSYYFKTVLLNLYVRRTMKFSDKQTEDTFEKRLYGGL